MGICYIFNCLRRWDRCLPAEVNGGVLLWGNEGSRIQQGEESVTTKASAQIMGALQLGWPFPVVFSEARGSRIYASSPTGHWMWATRLWGCDFGWGGSLWLRAVPRWGLSWDLSASNTAAGGWACLSWRLELGGSPQHPPHRFSFWHVNLFIGVTFLFFFN